MTGLPHFFCHQFVLRLATLTAATEAALFSIESAGGTGFSVERLVHIRPGRPTSAERRRAVAAFKDFVRRCCEQRRNGVIPVGKGVWCLIALLRDESRIRGAIAVIIRANDRRAALRRLKLLQGRREGLDEARGTKGQP